ncbi:MAG TPA: hypothetical protein VF390_02920 [Patescibacteria group bacterium]
MLGDWIPKKRKEGSVKPKVKQVSCPFLEGATCNAPKTREKLSDPSACFDGTSCIPGQRFPKEFTAEAQKVVCPR